MLDNVNMTDYVLISFHSDTLEETTRSKRMIRSKMNWLSTNMLVSSQLTLLSYILFDILSIQIIITITTGQNSDPKMSCADHMRLSPNQRLSNGEYSIIDDDGNSLTVWCRFDYHSTGTCLQTYSIDNSIARGRFTLHGSDTINSMFCWPMFKDSCQQKLCSPLIK